MPKRNSNASTSKMVKHVGTAKYINAETGEVEIFDVTEFQNRDFDFTKIWFKNFINTLELVGNKKTKLAYWIIDNLSKENLLPMTYRQISEGADTSLETVRITMQILMDGDFLRRINQGCYCVNPDIVFKGTRAARLNVLNVYNKAERVRMTKKQKLESIENAIAELEEQKKQLLAQTIDVKIDKNGTKFQEPTLLPELDLKQEEEA